jgi:DNA-binding phage protein
MALETIRFNIQDFLKTIDERRGILEAALEVGDPELVATIMEDIRKAEPRTGSDPDAPEATNEQL